MVQLLLVILVALQEVGRRHGLTCGPFTIMEPSEDDGFNEYSTQDLHFEEEAEEECHREEEEEEEGEREEIHYSEGESEVELQSKRSSSPRKGHVRIVHLLYIGSTPDSGWMQSSPPG